MEHATIKKIHIFLLHIHPGFKCCILVPEDGQNMTEICTIHCWI